MNQKKYLDRLSQKRKFLFGVNLMLIGLFGIFLPILPGILSILLGLFFIYPKLGELAKSFLKNSISSVKEDSKSKIS